jgi:inosose dehydratase
LGVGTFHCAGVHEEKWMTRRPEPTRREFAGVAAVIAGHAVLPRSMAKAAPRGYHPTLVAHTIIWLKQYKLQKKAIAENLEAAFASTHRAGYRRVELMPELLGADLRDRTRELLGKCGLAAPIVALREGPLHEEIPAEKTIKAGLELARHAKSMGAVAITFNPQPKRKEERKSDQELDVQARNLNHLGAELHKLGLKLMVHQHGAEMAEDAREWRHEVHHTDPLLVSFCVDVPWVYLGGQNPVEILRVGRKRIASLHLRNLKQGVRTEVLSEGDIDYRAIASALKGDEFQGFLVVELSYQPETQVTRSIEENLRLSRLFSEDVFGLRQ